MRAHDFLYIIVHDPEMTVAELRSFWARLPEHGEVWVERSDGSRVCALLSSRQGWMMYLRHEADPGFSTRNPRYSGPPDATLEFMLSNEQLDLFPAAWTYPAEDVLRGLEQFAVEGVFPREFEWHNDSRDGTRPPVRPAD